MKCDQYLQLTQLVIHFILRSKVVGVKFDNLNTTKWNIYIINEKTKLTSSSLMNAKQVSRCKKTFETFKTMMKNMTNSGNLAQQQIIIRRKKCK